MPLRRPPSATARAFIAFALPLLLAACGGAGTSSGSAPDPAIPISVPDIPVPRSPIGFQAADAVLGQPNPDVGEANQGQPKPASHSMFFPVGLALTPTGGLLVTDAGNHRVLLFDAVPSTSGASAVEVLGQPGFETAGSSVSRGGLNQPSAVAVREGRMVVADAMAHRVLVYDRIPEPGAQMPEPVAVIGQPGFESGDPACTRAGLAFPSSVFITPGGQLIVADAWNHRVLVWDAVPATQAAVRPPTRVVGQRLLNSCIRNDDDESGQEDFDERTGLSVASARTLRFPSGVWSDGTRLVVADTANHRVLVWNTFPQDDFAPADIVLGHSDITATTPNDNNVQPKAGTLFGPQDIDSDGISLMVADTANNRVLVWKAFPDRDFQPADIVLGHAVFDQRVPNDQDGDGRSDGPTAKTFERPLKVLLTPDALLVSDSFHNRVLVFRR